MILLFNKIQQQNEYGNSPYNDGWLAKVYIFSDLTNISKYLNCNLHEITDIFQNRNNLSQDISTYECNYKATNKITITEYPPPITFTQTTQDLTNSFGSNSNKHSTKDYTQEIYHRRTKAHLFWTWV